MEFFTTKGRQFRNFRCPQEWIDFPVAPIGSLGSDSQYQGIIFHFIIKTNFNASIYYKCSSEDNMFISRL